jgi:hypothetical protein
MSIAVVFANDNSKVILMIILAEGMQPDKVSTIQGYHATLLCNRKLQYIFITNPEICITGFTYS